MVTRGAVRRGPYLGEHTEAVLTELCGYSPGQVSELAAEGVFGSKGRVEPE
jgi:crotonobetainyl-CoA:carnitine CoA-transferase CaiB-like acyl-CoA transferase